MIGSSPLTRGTQIYLICKPAFKRFIPAYAGNSAPKRLLLFRLSVHPRLRGELVPSDPTAVILNGSSPLTRGTPKRNDLDGYPGRFIPAYAGNSLLRLCFHGGLHGSSPLTRGTLINEYKNNGIVRFIPAYAGNSSSARASRILLIGSSPLTRGTQLNQQRKSF